MKIQEFDHSIDVTRSLLWRHNQAENLQALINNKKSALDELNQGFWNDWYTDVFNLQTANEFGLSLWSIILDIPLSVEPADPAPPNTNFGFGPFRKNFGNGNFSPSENQVVLSKEEARRVLKLRYYQLITRATIPECNKIAREVFFDLGSVYVGDNQDMTMTYYMGFAPDAQIRFILDNYDLLPRPSGVEINYFFDANSFITTWKTDNAGVSASNQIQLPLVSSGTYDFYIDKGDGTPEIHITSWNQPETLIEFSSAGTYDVVIRGQCEGWMFNNGGDKDKILNVSRWGDDFRLGNSGLYFFGCSNLSTINATDAPNLSGTTSLGGAFYNCSSLVSITSGNLWDTSGITRANTCFRNCTSFIGGCAQWDVSNITIINDMFRGASIYNEDISGWITSNFTSTANMFSGATLFDQPIGSWDMSNVTNASAMFVSGAFNQDISGWNTGKMANMNSMFLGMTLFDQDLGGWDVSSLTQAINMLLNSTLSTANYDSLLTGWDAQTLQSGVTFHGGGSKYSAGAPAAARANMIAADLWVIADGGPV